MTTWTMQVRGVRRLRQRLAFTVAHFSRLVWWSTIVVIPVFLLAIAVSVGGESVYFYTMYSAAMIMALFQSSEQFVNTTIDFDKDAGKLTATYHMGDPTLYGNERQVTVSFEDVKAARFLPSTNQTLVRLSHEKPFAEGTAFLAPPEIEERFRNSLRRHDVSIQRDRGEESTRWVRGRCVVTALTLGAIPVSAVFIWPVYYSWAILLVLVLQSIVLLMQGW